MKIFTRKAHLKNETWYNRDACADVEWAPQSPLMGPDTSDKADNGDACGPEPTSL